MKLCALIFSMIINYSLWRNVSMAVDIYLYILCCIILSLYYCSGDQNIWHSYQMGSGYANREELAITKVITDNNFTVEENVLAWKTLPGNGRVYGIGMSKNAIVVLNIELSIDGKRFVARKKVGEFPWEITGIELFQHWNSESRKLEIILISATLNDNYSELKWYKINGVDLELFWTWPIQKKISYMRSFQLENEKYRLLILNDTLDLYEFSVNSPKPNFWLSQTLSLSSPANSSAINFYGSDTYLSIPQKQQNEVRIYKMVRDHFVFWNKISSNNVNQVASFKIGFKSFLAINGENPSIYKFVKDNIEVENVNGIHLSNVDFWLPVPIKSYRDEVALILQRTVDHNTHQSNSLDVLLYDGHNFNTPEEVPCSFYGEAAHGLDCMVDEDGYHGLVGVAVVSLKDILGILVPHKSKNVMFMMETVLKERKSPVEIEIEKLIETREQLQKMISEQKAQIETIQKRVEVATREDDVNVVTSMPVYQETSTTVIVPLSDDQVIHVGELKNLIDNFGKDLEETKTTFAKLKQTANRFDTLHVHGDVEVLGEINFTNINTSGINNKSVSEVLHDTVRKDAGGTISGHKTFKSLVVDGITFAIANGIKSEDLIYKTDEFVTINGNLVFEKFVEISGDVTTSEGAVNNLTLMNEVVEMKKTYDDSFEFEHVRVSNKLNTAQANKIPIQKTFADIVGDFSSNVDTLDLDSVEMLGNITVESVNGENFHLFKNSLCLIDVDTYIPGETFMADNLHVHDSANIQYLNGLKFPEEYLFTQSDFATISGKKFLNPLHADQFVVQGSINGIAADDIVTLSTRQDLPGTFLFNDLEVTEVINVEGNITGPFVDKFLPNPGLLDSNSINAKANFKTLIVEGNIIVSENYNKQKLQDLLQDVIYMTDGYALISSAKNFSRGLFVTNGITTASQQINSIPLSSIITTNTAQTITMKTLNGAVVFQNLLVQGLYGDINITKLDQETVKLSGDQFLSSTLTFVNNGAMVDLTATKMEISDTLNEFPVNNYYYDSDGSADMDINLIDLSKVQARKIVIEGNLLGSIDNFSLQEFDEKRLSATRRQQITAKYTIRNLDVENLNAKRVNGELFRKLFDHHYYLDHISNSFTAGDLHVKNINVNGNLSITIMNGEDINEFLKSCVWSDRNNNITEAIFEGDLYLNHLKLFDFNGVPFKLFTDYVVYKGEEHPVINGFKTFLNGFRVTRMLNSEHLNRIHVDNILTKSGKQEVRGPLSINGNVVINYDTEVYGSLNGIAMSYLRNTYQYENNTCVINDDLMFHRVPRINNLFIDGYINDVELNEFFQNIVYKSQNGKTPTNVTFLNKIHIKQNLNVKNNINDVDFSEFVEDIVVITKDDVIGGDVTFAQPVYVEHELVVDNNLETKYLSGADLDNWKENAVFTDRGIIPGKLMFEYVTIQGEVYLNYINDLDLKSLIPLRTDQYINQSLQFLEITPFHNISVQNQVNGYVLLDEYHNSILMDHYLHEVASDIVFDGNVLVRNNLQIVGLVDGKNLSKVVSTNTEQKLTANYEFHNEITIRGNLEVAGWINDIDVKEWNVRSVKTNHEFEQVISDNWALSDSMVFSENVFGDALLQGIDVVQLADTVEKKRLMKVSAENGIVDDYKNICKDVNIMMKAAETQIYLFKYFEHLQNFKFSSEIENVHHFEANDKDYILITNKSSCTSELLAWFKTEFSKISIIRTGTISQMISVRSDNLLFFVSRSSEFLKDCKYFGTNIWKFDHQGLVPFYKLENYKLLEESLIPGTFYALSDDFVVEYHLHMKEEDHVKIHRKWRISNDNWRFVPKGSGLGLCLSNGYKLLKLNRYDLIEESEYGYGTDVFLRGHVVEEYTKFIPPRNEGDITIMNVGIGNYKRSLVAVTSHDKTSVKGKFDFVKIYEDIVTGKLFHKVPTYKPSSLLSLEFGNNGETLLIFLEDQKLIQVYEYKGIEGCKHKTTIKVPGTKLFSMTVPTEKKHTRNRIVGIVNGHDLTLLNAVMTGNQISIEHPHCKL